MNHLFTVMNNDCNFCYAMIRWVSPCGFYVDDGIQNVCARLAFSNELLEVNVLLKVVLK